MRREAVALSVAVHLLAVLSLIPHVAPEAKPDGRTAVTKLAPPPAVKTEPSRTRIGRGIDRGQTASVDLPVVPDSVLIDIDAATFHNVFVAADHWRAVLRSGVTYPDPGSVPVIFCNPSEFPELRGQHGSGAVWFAFPIMFRHRILEKIKDVAVVNNVMQPDWAVIAFTTTGPDYFDVRSVGTHENMSPTCS